MPRIRPGMHLSQAATALTGDRIGTRLCCLWIADHARKLYPNEDMVDYMTTLRRIDRMGIYDADLGVLYRHVCRNDARTFLNLVRAYEYKLIGRREIAQAIARARLRHWHGINHDAVIQAIDAFHGLLDFMRSDAAPVVDA